MKTNVESNKDKKVLLKDFVFHLVFFMAETTESNSEVPDVQPSQVLSVNPSLPTNKLLDNLTVKRIISSLGIIRFVFSFLQKNQRLLQSLPQNYEKRHYFTGLFKTLLDDFFFSHERADIQLYAAICIADIIRIYAPNLPDVPTEKLMVNKQTNENSEKSK